MALERMETFCNEFKPGDIYFFGMIVEKIDLPEHTVKYIKQNLQETLKTISIFILDSRKGFPHGGKLVGEREPITNVLRYLVYLIQKINSLIETIYKKLDYKIFKSYTYLSGYSKKLLGLEKKFLEAVEKWKDFIDPLTTMIASPLKPFTSRKAVSSRAVNTLNRFNKRISLPKAQLYQGNHFEEMPLATIIRPSLSPRRKSRRKNKTVKGTRI